MKYLWERAFLPIDRILGRTQTPWSGVKRTDDVLQTKALNGTFMGWHRLLQSIFCSVLLFDTGLEHNLKYGREMRDDWIICSKSISASKKRDICHELSTCYVCLLSRRAIYVNIFGALLIQGYWTIYRQLYRDRRTIKTNSFPPRKKKFTDKRKTKQFEVSGSLF